MGGVDEGCVLPSVTLNLNLALYMPLNCTHAIQSLLLPYDVKGGKGVCADRGVVYMCLCACVRTRPCANTGLPSRRSRTMEPQRLSRRVRCCPLGLFFSGTELEIMGSCAHKRVHP